MGLGFFDAPSVIKTLLHSGAALIHMIVSKCGGNVLAKSPFTAIPMLSKTALHQEEIDFAQRLA
jgi:hypothetical protein